MVEESPWPLFSSIITFMLTSSILFLFSSSKNVFILILSLMVLLMLMWQWWRDIDMEGSLLGFHSKHVEQGLRMGMILFIISEVFFFVSFFWAFFHSSLVPAVDIYMQWPPMGITPFNPFTVPLLNTLILLSSGVTVTWAHHSILMGNMNISKLSLATTVLLGVYFTIMQAYEYVEATFSIHDSAYGSTFFVATGFHGLHVIVGTIFLLSTLIRLLLGRFSTNHHFGFEASAWYWHFVDVVWLFLFVVIYWWSAN